MSAVYGLYGDPDAAQRGVNALRAAGVRDADLVVLSAEPFDEYEFGRRDHATLMPWLAALGGALGGTAGFWLASTTQELWPLPTASMPIVPMWTDGIIIYELTMLGAILTTLGALLGTARLPRWNVGLYDAEVSNGKILVGVANLSDRVARALEPRLREAGAGEVKVVW